VVNQCPESEVRIIIHPERNPLRRTRPKDLRLFFNESRIQHTSFGLVFLPWSKRRTAEQARSQLRGSDGFPPSSRASWRFLSVLVEGSADDQYVIKQSSMTSTFKMERCGAVKGQWDCSIPC
jgi:hypothetical protein